MTIIPLIQIILALIAASIIAFIVWDNLRQNKKQSIEKKPEDLVEKMMVLIEEVKQTTLSSQKSNYEDIIAIQVMPRQTNLLSRHLLFQTLAENDFHYGDMHIFHRYENNIQKTKKLFSVASATEPGDFDLYKKIKFYVE